MKKINTISGNYPWIEEDFSWPVETEVGPGLQGVIASPTEISWLDPTSGSLNYRGFPIEHLAGLLDFESVAHLLITGKTPANDLKAYEEFKNKIRGSLEIPNEVLELVYAQGKETHPTRLLRAGISALGCHEMGIVDDMSGKDHWREMRIVGQVAGLVGEIARFRRDQNRIEMHKNLDLAESMLWSLLDRKPEKREIKALNLLWVLYADHGMDAPTFTSMIVASCLADPYYNIVAGLSALRGKKLGGASEDVYELLSSFSNENQARNEIRHRVESGKKIPGFGHRTYNIPDPRVVILRKEYAAISRKMGVSDRFNIARAVEDEATRLLSSKGIFININFYAALLFNILGAEKEMLPCMIAVGRMAGLVARVNEAMVQNRLYRPLSFYTGPEVREVGK